MSEDCHDSNNEPNGAEIGTAVPCHFCHEDVAPGEAYVCELENRDGTSSPAVFHKGADRMCGLKWAAELLEEWNGRMEAILALFKYVDDGRERK
jgi:hypothetical protein